MVDRRVPADVYGNALHAENIPEMGQQMHISMPGDNILRQKIRDAAVHAIIDNTCREDGTVSLNWDFKE